MAKAVFHPNEIVPSDAKVFLELARTFSSEEEPDAETVEAEPVYEGPTVEDLEKEAEEWRADFEIKKAREIAAAKDEADRILKEAETAAFEDVRRKTNEAQAALQKARDEAAEIEANAKEAAARIEEEARAAMEAQKKEAHDAAFAEGREAGFQTGKDEAARLIDRLHAMHEGLLEKRQEILNETEQQIVDLVLLMTRKVVKAISENSKAAIAANVVQALRKLKSKCPVTLRVNLKDEAFAAQHVKEFIAAVENVDSLSVVEDSTVDPGGCIVETDFGEIDARIMSQLDELEQKVLEISPIKSRQRAQEKKPAPQARPASGNSQ